MHEVADRDPEETRDWLESLDAAVQHQGKDRARFLLKRVLDQARRQRVAPSRPLTTDFVNTIPVEEEPPFPGDQWMEKRIRRIIRWNAMAMVYRANMNFSGIGGHLSTYASSATLYEVGFNHFFKGAGLDGPGDPVFSQGHAAPGTCPRPSLPGRPPPAAVDRSPPAAGRGVGLAAYPHP